MQRLGQAGTLLWAWNLFDRPSGWGPALLPYLILSADLGRRQLGRSGRAKCSRLDIASRRKPYSTHFSECYRV
jgi:hypothetical protein